VNVQGWKDLAKCRGLDTNIFMPDDSGVIYKEQMERAVAICASCLVIDECRDYAIAEEIVVGIYGGLSERGRAAFARGNKGEVRELWNVKHGTLSAYQRHRCRCAPCAEAGRDHWRKNQEKRKAKKEVA